jgi:Ca2+-binding RTX toxin-like protein
VTQLTIPGAAGTTVTFNVTGNSTTNYAKAFSAAVTAPTVITALSDGGQESTVVGALNIIQSPSTAPYTLTTPGQYTYAAVTAPTQINGSAGSDTVLGSGGLTYVANGNNNNVAFVAGDNIYFGGAGGGNTISGGSGSDSIVANSGSNTIFSGTGNAIVNLADVSSGNLVALFSGNTGIVALGNDTVYASAALNAATTGVIFGGAGTLDFVAGSSASTLAVSIVGGSGYTNMFAGAGSDIVFANADGAAVFVAGTGNETLNGFNANGGFAFFGDTIPGDAASINDTVYGGAGLDYFSTGGGNEYIVAGPGAALFDINNVDPAAHITIADFGSGDYVNFAGLSPTAETSLLQTSSAVSNGNLTITLQNGTQVEFLSTTSLAGHIV